ncbi:MAG: 4Fe-4S dicluster domain-containing protein [Deltaproteobacteria bacterium]|nr:4Fe-4S dicluster domain-containing protein [Deltaproteobacteria bacterium]NIS78076.1 4Fe-4S dicluster domain-containing protein [Deltaproteobacteria bacterium]
MATGELVRMHEDLDRALQKKKSDRSWVMVVDMRKCIECHACAVSCMAENVTPIGMSYRVVYGVESGDYPDLDRFPMPTNCQHCDDPPCKEACDKHEKEAIKKRSDGIVILNYEKLKKNPKAGEEAVKACPYTAISLDKGDFYTDGTPNIEPYETREFFENGSKHTRKGKKLSGTIRKCTFCLHRLEAGLIPACVSTCIGRAMYFGDGRDPKSLVSELIGMSGTRRINESFGTSPRVYYVGYAPRKCCNIVSPASCTLCHE